MSASSLPPDIAIDAHRAGDVVWLDWFCLPARARGQGHGRAAYDAWESALPVDITCVRLFAADTGDGRSDGFWERLGFSYVYDTDNPDALDDDDRYAMWKGVNGHTTPRPVWVEDAGDIDEAVNGPIDKNDDKNERNQQ